MHCFSVISQLWTVIRAWGGEGGKKKEEIYHGLAIGRRTCNQQIRKKKKKSVRAHSQGPKKA